METKKYILGKDYKDLKIRTKKIKDKVLLTNDYNKWLVLSKKEYDQINFKNLDEPLFKKLEEDFMILTDNNNEKISHHINRSQWHISNGTSLHIIIPTLRCNFTCKYCYAFRCIEEEKDKDMSLETADKTVEFIFKGPAKTHVIEFSGGEPLLRYDIVQHVILKAEELGKKRPDIKLKFSIVTNGTFLKEEMLKFLRKHKVGVCISVDGPKDIHDENRRITKGNKPSYDEVIKTLEMLKKNKYPSINSIPVFLKRSLEEWKTVVDHYIELGFNSIRFKYVSQFGFASDLWNSMSYTPETYLDSWEKAMDYMLELNKKGVTITENISTYILKKLFLGIEPGYAEMQRPCGAVTGQIVYNYDGAIYTCDEARTMPEFKIGDVYTSEYIDLVKCKTTQTLHNISNLTATCDECSYFSFCGICPLEVYVQEKGFITNIPANYRCKIHMGMFNYIFEKIIEDDENKRIFEIWANVSSGNFACASDDEMIKNMMPFELEAKSKNEQLSIKETNTIDDSKDEEIDVFFN